MYLEEANFISQSTRSLAEKTPVILPEKYYLDYFNYLIDFVERHYEHVLDTPEYLFIQHFQSLSEDAKCLYLRFSNRKGDFFRISKVEYKEITDLESAKLELLTESFIDINQSLDPLQFRLFTKAELVATYDFLEKKYRKEELLLELTEEDIPALFEREEIAEVKMNQEVEFLKLLFFGNRYHQMTEFVIRDVGNVKLRTLDESRFKPWFETRQDALGIMHISQLKRMIRDIMQTDLPLQDFLDEMPWNEWLGLQKSKEAASKLLVEIGAHFERTDNPEEALKFYRLTGKPPANERKIRLLEKLGSKEEAIQCAEYLVNNPTNAAELTFATDFLNRSGIRINRSMTKRLQSAPTIELVNTNSRVEQQVLDYFQNQGWNGIHGENFIWRSIFGLVFWEELFDQAFGAFHHPLQRQPSDLHEESFYQSRKELLQKRLNSFRSRKSFITYLHKVHEENQGISNRFVSWFDELLPLSETIVHLLPLKGLKNVLLEIAKQTKENSTGFPDLFLWNATDYQFYEVKSPNDHLSAQQLFWLDFLSSSGIKADIIRVKYLNE